MYTLHVLSNVNQKKAFIFHTQNKNGFHLIQKYNDRNLLDMMYLGYALFTTYVNISV